MLSWLLVFSICWGGRGLVPRNRIPTYDSSTTECYWRLQLYEQVALLLFLLSSLLFPLSHPLCKTQLMVAFLCGDLRKDSWVLYSSISTSPAIVTRLLDKCVCTRVVGCLLLTIISRGPQITNTKSYLVFITRCF